MQPGLHSLECSRCGAPLDPTERAKGDVVKCEHCGQPHLWVAPGRVEAQGGSGTSRAGASAGAGLAVVAAIAVAAVAALTLATAGAFFWMRAAPALPRDVVAAPDMPLAIGDDLNMQIDNHSCSVRVQAVLDDGRIVGVPCKSEQTSPIDRSRLTLEAFTEKTSSYRNLEPRDVVLAKTAAGWARRVVVGLEAGKRVRLRALVPSGDETIAAQSEVLRVQRSSTSGVFFAIPLPESAPIEVGDVFWISEGNVRIAVRVESVDDANVTLQTGWMSDDGFKADRKAPITRRRTALLVDAIVARDRLASGGRVLMRDGARWLRRVVVSDDGSYATLKDEKSGAQERRAKENMLIVQRRR